MAIPLCAVPVLEFLPRKDVRRRNQHIQGLECRKKEDRDSTRGILCSMRVDSLHTGTHGRSKVVFLTYTRHSTTKALPSGCWCVPASGMFILYYTLIKEASPTVLRRSGQPEQ